MWFTLNLGLIAHYDHGLQKRIDIKTLLIYLFAVLLCREKLGF